MKIFKTVVGIIIIIASTKTIIEMYSEESGAGLFGAFTGYIIFMTISFWLIYSANKNQPNTNIKNRSLTFHQVNHNIKNNTQKASENEQEQKKSLQLLKDKGLLTEQEYETKKNILEMKINLRTIYNSIEFVNLAKLYDSDLLSQEEFDIKIQMLIESKKEEKENDLKNQDKNLQLKLVKAKKSNLKKEVSDYSKSDLYGKWKFEDGYIVFYYDDKTNEDKLTIKYDSELPTSGSWKLTTRELVIKLNDKNESDYKIIEIDELDTNIFKFNLDDHNYVSVRDQFLDKNEW